MESNKNEYGDKKAVAKMFGLSERTIDNLIAQGMPHLKIGKRRCRFDMAEVRDWMREQFRVVRRKA